MYKKILIIMIFTFYLLGFFVLFNDKVSAREISQFCEYTEPCLTTENVEELINNSGIDTSVYDKYVLTLTETTYEKVFSIFVLKTEDTTNGNFKFSLVSDDSYYYSISSTSYYFSNYVVSKSKTFDKTFFSNISLGFYELDNNQSAFSYFANTLENIPYYSNFDVLDNDGNVVLEKNSYNYYNQLESIYSENSPFTNFELNESVIFEYVQENGLDTSIYNGYFCYISNNNKVQDGRCYIFDKSYAENKNFYFTDITNGSYEDYELDININSGKFYMFSYSKFLENPIDFVFFEKDKLNTFRENTNMLSTSLGANKQYYFSNADIYCDDINQWLPATTKEENEFQYVFDEDIYGTKYSKVELVFDIKGNMEQDFDFNYDFHLIQPNGKLDELSVFNSPYFEEVSSLCSSGSCSLPKNRFFRILKDLSLPNSSEFDSEYLYDEFFVPNKKSSNSNSYVVDNYHIDINKDILVKSTQSLKFVIDLTFDEALIIDSYFESSIPFKVIYYERNSETSDVNYYETIDMTGKYGVMFLPKVDTSAEAVNIRTLFKGEGHLDVQHRSSYDPENYKVLSSYSLNYCHDYLLTQSDIPYQCNKTSGSFEFYITNDNLYQSLFFVNSVYDNSLTSNASVSYDTRYYTFYVFDTPDTVIEITNPNTGETTSISLKLFYNFVSYKENLGFSFNSFLKPINFIISSITEFYNDFCPPVVQKFFYVSFVLLVVLFIIKLIW